jgi:hypothetical protein
VKTRHYIARGVWRCLWLPPILVFGCLFFLTLVAMRGPKFARAVFDGNRYAIDDAELTWQAQVRLLKARARSLAAKHSIKRRPK